MAKQGRTFICKQKAYVFLQNTFDFSSIILRFSSEKSTFLASEFYEIGE